MLTGDQQVCDIVEGAIVQKPWPCRPLNPPSVWLLLTMLKKLLVPVILEH